MEDLTGRQLGQYRIVGPLGQGGMAAVYKAYQASVERYVALKILPSHYSRDADFVRRFKREAKVIAGLEHPNILPIHDHGEADGFTYIVMRFVEGGTLKDLLHGAPLPLSQTCQLISQIAAALDHAHSKGIIHRDVKPSNVLLDSHGNCLLTDFGIARILEATGRFTSTGAFLGTPTYASPEQAMGRALDGRSDVYSLGIMLFEITTGHPPFDAETPMAILIKHIHDPLPMPRAVNPELPEAVERVILKALAKEPADRYQTAGEMAKALAAAATAGMSFEEIAASGWLGGPPASERPAASRRRIPFWGWAAIGLAAACLGVATVGGGIWLVSRLGGTQAMGTVASNPRPAPAAASQASTQPAVPGTTAPAEGGPMVSTFAATSDLMHSPSVKTLAPATRTWQDWTQARSFPSPGSGPTGIVRSGDTLWVNIPCSNRIFRLDLEGNPVGELEMPKPGCGPGDVGLAWDGTSLWGIWGSTVVQMDPNNAQALSEFEADMEGCSLAWDGSSLWVVDRAGNLSAYDRNGRRLRRLAIPVFGVVSGIAWVDGELWMLNEFGDVTRFDEDFLEVGSFSLASTCRVSSFHMQRSFGLHWDGEGLWVADATQNHIFQCTPSGE